MAILIVEHNGALEGATLRGRVLIGRRSSNHVVIDHPDVSRIHAWIDTADQAFCIIDAGSRTGTFVNGHRVTGKLSLRDGDRMSVGPASLIFRVSGSLPAGVSQLDFGDRTAANDGILFDCACGAPLWISSAFAGRMGKCRFCGTVVRVPKRSDVKSGEHPAPFSTPADTRTDTGVVHTTPVSTAVSAPADAPDTPFQPGPANARATADRSPAPALCGACQSPIEIGEALAPCPSCGLTFHVDCWRENYGCSAYGCSQVNILASAPEAPSGDTPTAATGEEGFDAGAAPNFEAASKLPAGHLLLAGSVVGLLVGLFTFGSTALLSLVAELAYLKRHRGRWGDKVVLAAIAISAVGIIAGIGVSYAWWLGGGQAAGSEGR